MPIGHVHRFGVVARGMRGPRRREEFENPTRSGSRGPHETRRSKPGLRPFASPFPWVRSRSVRQTSENPRPESWPRFRAEPKRRSQRRGTTREEPLVPLPLTRDQLVNTPKTGPHDDGQMPVIRDFRIVVDLDSPRISGEHVLRHGNHLRQFGTNSELLGRSRNLRRDFRTRRIQRRFHGQLLREDWWWNNISDERRKVEFDLADRIRGRTRTTLRRRGAKWL